MEKKNEVSELDLFRHMQDQAARVQMNSQWHKRNSDLQRLMAKIQTLSDAEFEKAYDTFESLVNNFNQRNAQDSKKKEVSPEKQLGLTNNESNQTPKKSA
jgi:hypothetical protein